MVRDIEATFLRPQVKNIWGDWQQWLVFLQQTGAQLRTNRGPPARTVTPDFDVALLSLVAHNGIVHPSGSHVATNDLRQNWATAEGCEMTHGCQPSTQDGDLKRAHMMLYFEWEIIEDFPLPRLITRGSSKTQSQVGLSDKVHLNPRVYHHIIPY